MGGEDLLDLARVELAAAAVDDVVEAPGDAQPAGGVESAQAEVLAICYSLKGDIIRV